MSRLTRRVLLVTGLLALPCLAVAQHTSQFEFTETFVRSWAHDPVADLAVKFDCASNEHVVSEDCEIHLGAELSDPSVSDFQGLVLEPPNVCKDAGVNWKTVLTPTSR